MTNSMKSVCMAAAVAGLLGGTTIRMQAQPVAGQASGASFVLHAARSRQPAPLVPGGT